MENEEFDINRHDSRGLAPIHYLGLREVDDELFSLVCRETENPLMPVASRTSDAIITVENVEITNGDNVLHLAARSNNKEIALRFQHRFNYINNVENEEGSTPLSDAIATLNVGMLDFILGKGILPKKDDLDLAKDFLADIYVIKDACKIYKKLALALKVEPKIIQDTIATSELDAKELEDEERSDKEYGDDDSLEEDRSSPSSSPSDAELEEEEEIGNTRAG